MQVNVEWGRSDLDCNILQEKFNAFLAISCELLEYASYLRHFPCKSAQLILPQCCDEDKRRILEDAKQEWHIICLFEQRPSTRQWLHQNCLYVTYQSYRELMVTCEQNAWTWCSAIEDVIRSWHPSFTQSANLESIFREMEQTVKKTGFAQDSMPNLACVAIRAMERRVCASEFAPKTVKLNDQDWDGRSVRGLKARMFNPASVSPCL